MNGLEPWFTKLMLLLRSKSESSTEQIRLLLEECIRKKHGPNRLLKPIPSFGVRKNEQPADSSGIVEDFDSGEGSSKSEKLIMDILEEDLSCKVCRNVGLTLETRLIECAECHSLYHQECHIPSIADADVSDPRVVWYCAVCSKTISEPETSPIPKPVQPRQVSELVPKPYERLNSEVSTAKKISRKQLSSKSLASIMNIKTADKRILHMKKKAAKKQEKRIYN